MNEQTNKIIKEQIAQAIKNQLPIDQAFKEISQKLEQNNNTDKEILKELIAGYTKDARAQLIARSEELDAAVFALNKAENELADMLRTSFNALLDTGLNDVCKEYLEELALSELGDLQILSQTSQNAFINILEEGSLIKERARALASYLLISANKQLNATRILKAARLILEQALEMANLWQSYANELIYGCIDGLYEALELICERGICELKTSNTQTSAKALLNLETDFASTIASLASNDYAGQILRQLYDNELASLSAKFSRALGRGRYVLGMKLDELINDNTRRSAAMLKVDARAAASRLIAKLRK